MNGYPRCLTERGDCVQSKPQPLFPRCSALTYFRPEYTQSKIYRSRCRMTCVTFKFLIKGLPPKLREQTSRAIAVSVSLPKVLYCISYSVVSKKKEDFDSCRVCRLNWQKRRFAATFCASRRGPSSTTPMTNRHLIQLNFINSQPSTENNKVHSAYVAIKCIVRCLGCTKC